MNREQRLLVERLFPVSGSPFYFFCQTSFTGGELALPICMTRPPLLVRSALTLLVVATGGCGASARLPVTAGMGPTPTLPEPSTSVIPLVNVVDAKGWPEGASPTAVPGTKPRSGYKIIFVPFTEGMPSGAPIDVLTGFVTANGDALGRPVGVAIDARGGLLVADDVGNTIWRVSGRQAAVIGVRVEFHPTLTPITVPRDR